MATLSEQEREALLWRCPCGHNSWTAHSGRGCDECDCDRDEEGAVLATTEEILTARLADTDHLRDLLRAVKSYDDVNQSDLPLSLLNSIRAALASDPTREGDAHGNAE